MVKSSLVCLVVAIGCCDGFVVPRKLLDEKTFSLVRVRSTLPVTIKPIDSYLCSYTFSQPSSKDRNCHFHCHPQRFRSVLNLFSSALECDTPEDDAGRRLIDWIDPMSYTPSFDLNDTATMTVPLYPLSDIAYIPDSLSNCTLCNTAPRNLQMALDLPDLQAVVDNATNITDRVICVVLQAVDTGRIATVGTLLRVLKMHVETDATFASRFEEQEPTTLQQIRRIVLTCVPETTVDICTIVNPLASTLEHRLRYPNEYLRATVRRRQQEQQQQTSSIEDVTLSLQTIKQIQKDYEAVRTMYINGVEGKKTVPSSYTLSQVSKLLLPNPVTSFDLTDPVDVWRLATVWQTLCETVRDGHQQALAADRNELLIDAAIQLGGPLQLPVHVEDILPQDRQRVQLLEQDAQDAWRLLELDPCLDFQVLISRTTRTDRLEHLSKMIARERQRLTTGPLPVLTVMGDRHVTYTKPSTQQPQKGAWFDDAVW